jgi:exportin-5
VASVVRASKIIGMATVPSSGAFGTAAAGDGGEEILLKVHEALKVVHSPYSTNQTRQEAQVFLESVKTLDEAPSHGFELSFRKPQEPIVRHYGLSLLEHAVKHKWEDYSPEHREYLRTWVLQLAETVSAEDPGYLRNKIAQLWVEVAKRSWVASWMDMDYLLVRLWQVPNSPVHKQFVLQILETLSDEIFNGDDAVVALREGALSKACVEIFTPAAILTEAFPNRQAGPDVRFESEGWLNRITQLISECLRSGLERNEDVRACVIKALNVLNSVVPWAIPKALHAVGCREVMCDGLAAPSVPVQKVRDILDDDQAIPSALLTSARPPSSRCTLSIAARTSPKRNSSTLRYPCTARPWLTSSGGSWNGRPSTRRISTTTSTSLPKSSLRQVFPAFPGAAILLCVRVADNRTDALLSG